jgi:hypothetical protein
MQETYATGRFSEIELTMMPVPPGTKGTPRPADRPREIIAPDNVDAPIPPPASQPPGADE